MDRHRRLLVVAVITCERVLIDKVRDKGGGDHYGYSWMAVSALEKEETFLKWERKLLPMP